MTHRTTARRCVLSLFPAAALAAAAAISTGCSTPHHWSVFDVRPYQEKEAHQTPPALAGMLAEGSMIYPHFEPPKEGPLELTVEQAVMLSMEHNRDLAVQRLTPTIVATFEDIERGVFDPELFAGVDYFEADTQETSRATGETFTTSRDDFGFEVGVRQRLPTGTTLEFDVSSDRSASDRTPTRHDARLGVTLTQSLLEGFGPAVNLARIRQAELDTVASLYELQGFAEALLAETESTYWLYALAARRIQIFEESLQVARLQLEEVEQRIDIGVTPRTEFASAEAEVAQREQDLIDARARLKTLRLRLLRLINPFDNDAMDLEIVIATEPDATPDAIEDLTDRVALALHMRPELNEARLRLDQRRLETIVTRNGVLPRLDFFVAFGKTGFADSFSRSYRELDGRTYDFGAGIAFSYPLGNRAADARHEGAMISRRQAAEAVRNLEQLVRLDVRIAAEEVERARQQIGASIATRVLRAEALRVENERFRVGQSTSILVAQAQRDLLESQITEVDAVIAYRLALIDLYLAEGTLLDRRGLSLIGDVEDLPHGRSTDSMPL
ncbi:MAG: TolC family protein [Phycisphaeraceae bacterium]|nr:MAG: TolC family protein [Phycisphaeraceae bacterium]